MTTRLIGGILSCALLTCSTVYSASFTVLGGGGRVSPDGSFVFNGTSRWTVADGWQTWDSYSGGSLTGGVSAVSYDGSVVAGSLNGNAYRWDASSGMVGLGRLPANYSYSVSGISADGSVIAGTGKDTTAPDISQAYRWTASTGMVGLSALAAPPSDPSSSSSAISADGNAVLGVDINADSSGYWNPDGSWTAIPDGSSNGMIAMYLPTVISEDGSVIAGSFVNREPWRWSAADGLEWLGIDIMQKYVNGISYDGRIIVGSQTTYGQPGIGAWMWDEVHGERFIQDVLIAEGIDLTGWDLTNAGSISADGSIITGSGLNPSGQPVGWVTNLSAIPVPPALWLFGSGLVGLIGLARRKTA